MCFLYLCVDVLCECLSVRHAGQLMVCVCVASTITHDSPLHFEVPLTQGFVPLDSQSSGFILPLLLGPGHCPYPMPGLPRGEKQDELQSDFPCLPSPTPRKLSPQTIPGCLWLQAKRKPHLTI